MLQVVDVLQYYFLKHIMCFKCFPYETDGLLSNFNLRKFRLRFCYPVHLSCTVSSRYWRTLTSVPIKLYSFCSACKLFDYEEDAKA